MLINMIPGGAIIASRGETSADHKAHGTPLPIGAKVSLGHIYAAVVSRP